MRELTYREKELINRGYDKDLVSSLTYFTHDEVNNASMKIFKELIKDCNTTNNPRCIFVGGQPGSGKSTKIDSIKYLFSDNIIIINMDLYRKYHPKYQWIVDTINRKWQGKESDDNDSPGNDLADFTHFFAGEVSDKLIELASEVINGEAYNIAIEWGMRNSRAPLLTLEALHNKGYYNEVIFIAVHKDKSFEACNYRDISTKNDLTRRVSSSFHELYINELPNSAKTIYEEGTSKGIINSFKLIDRNNNILWDNKSNEDLYEVYYNYLNK